MPDDSTCGCGSAAHVNRRTLLKLGAGATAWLTPLSQLLARDAERKPHRGPARSVIILWLQGGPSQLETFDPHPGSSIGGQTRAIKTAAPGVKLAAGFTQLADQMESISLVRSVMSKEADHERATYTMKTGFRPAPTLVHPSLGAVVCHQLHDQLDIPRHVSILPGNWPARGGYLGDQYDAFKIPDPGNRIPDVAARVSDSRSQKRIDDLFDVADAEFARGRLRNLDGRKTLHEASIRSALKMMSSEQLKAFDIKQAPRSVRREYGDTPFGRGCLAAVRLIEVGVRCVEVTLSGWDSHVNNYEIQTNLVRILDPAFASLIRDLKRRELLASTIVLCGGEFGRTPHINPAGGRDHWPHGFSVAMAGGRIHGGRIVGQTSPEPKLDEKNRLQDLVDPQSVADVHATVLDALGIDFTQELETPVGRPMIVSEGHVIKQLIT